MQLSGFQLHRQLLMLTDISHASSSARDISFFDACRYDGCLFIYAEMPHAAVNMISGLSPMPCLLFTLATEVYAWDASALIDRKNMMPGAHGDEQ